MGCAFFVLLHRSLQYFTASQFFSHFLRQVKCLLQTGQILVGNSPFLGIILEQGITKGVYMKCN